MNPITRLHALIRHPDYRTDAKVYIPTLKIGLLNFVFELSNGPLREDRWNQIVRAYTFLRTWGVSRPIDPENAQQVEEVLIALRSGDNSIFLNDLRGADAAEREEHIDPGSGCLIALYVDLQTPMPVLKNLFTQLVSRKRQELGIRVPKTNLFKADPWEVWDRMQLPGKYRSLRVARNLFGVRGHPKTHERAKAAVERVNRAYAKAESLIKEVGSSRNRSITEGAVETALVKGIRSIIESFSRVST